MALTKEQKQQIETEFDRMIGEAREGFKVKKPDMSAVDAQTYAAEMRQYNQALATFNQNPLLGRMDEIRKEVAEQRASGASEDKLKALEDIRIAELKEQIMSGVDKDLVNVQSRKQAQQDLVKSLWPPNVVGIATNLFRMLSGGNEWMDAANNTVSEALSGNVNDPQKAFLMAKENSFLTSGLASGLMGAGLSIDERTQSYIGSTVASAVAPTKQAGEGTTPPADTPPKDKEPEKFSAPNGSVPPVPAVPLVPANPFMAKTR